MKRLLVLLIVSAVAIFGLIGCKDARDWKELKIFVKGEVTISDIYLTQIRYTYLVVVDVEYGETTASPLSELNCSKVKFWYYSPDNRPITVGSKVEVMTWYFIKEGERLFLLSNEKDLLKTLKSEQLLSRPNLLNIDTTQVMIQ